MNIRDLGYVVALSELRHFSKAAQACYVSQPTLSAQIKKLEDELGVKLFERHQKKVWPTEAGMAIVQQAQRVLHEVRQLKGIAEGFNNPLSGHYRLGVIPTIGPYLLPKLLHAIKQQLPLLQLSIIEGKTEHICRMLGQGELDAALLAMPVETTSYKVFTLFREPILGVLPADHALAKNKAPLCVDHLRSEQLMLLEDGHCLRDQTMQICAIDHRSAQQLHASTSVETLRQMVALGHGMTLLPYLAAKQSIDDPMLAVRQLAKPQPYRDVVLLTPQHHAKIACAEQLSMMIQVLCQQLITTKA